MNKHTFLICLALGNSNIDKVCVVIDQFVTESCNESSESVMVNRMSKSRRVLATGGKQRSFGLHMVCFEMVLYHNEPH